VAVVAERFSQLPSTVHRDLESDPLGISFACAYLLSYSEAKRALDRAKDDKDLEAWKGSKVMREVRENTRRLGLQRKEQKEGTKAQRAEARALAKRMAAEKAAKKKAKPS
jgi:hypothetical protein